MLDLLLGMLALDPTKPCRCHLLCCRVFPKPDSLLDLLLGMLVLDPTKRITAGAALQHEWFRQVIGLSAACG